MRRLLGIVVLLGVVALALLVMRTALAQSSTPPVVVTASADTFTDRLQNTSSHDGQGLQLQSNDPAPPAGNAVKVVFMKFDLSGVSFSNGGAINRATLVLPAPGGTGCPTAAPALPLTLYGADSDAWDGTLTWGADRNAPTHPGRSPASPLATLDQGSVSTAPTVVTFTDDSNGPLAQFAEAERAGDGVMSLRLEIDGGTGNVLFNDTEDAAAGTATCLLPAERTPYLELRSDTPTAVGVVGSSLTLLSRLSLLVMLSVVLAATTVFVVVRRRMLL